MKRLLSLPLSGGPKALFVGLAMLALPSSSWAQDYRNFTLTDGRTFIAEVTGTDASGMQVRTQQGDSAVPYTALVDMIDSDAAAYGAQDPWAVFVAAGDAERAQMLPAVKLIPKLIVVGERGSEGIVAPDALQKAQACGADLACVRGALASANRWVWVVSAAPKGEGVALEGGVSTSDATQSTEVDKPGSPGVLANGIRRLFGLGEVEVVEQVAEVKPEKTKPEKTKPEKEPKTPKPVVETGGGTPGSLTRSKVLTMSWVPVPGMPSLMAGDAGSAGMAFAVVVPGTAAWVGVAGKQSQSAGQHIALSVGGYYALTVAMNQALGLRSLKKAGVGVAAGPRADGGVQIGIAVPLR